MKVKFFEKGRWCDNSFPHGGKQFDVKAGEVIDVSIEMMKVVLDAGSGELVLEDEVEDETEPEETEPEETEPEETEPEETEPEETDTDDSSKGSKKKREKGFLRKKEKDGASPKSDVLK